MNPKHYNYASMTKDELIRHCEAYAESLHELADRCMKAEWRVQHIERNILMADGLEA